MESTSVRASRSLQTGQAPLASKILTAFILILLVHLQFFCGLGAIGLVGPDEPRYAQVSREMAATGDYITPRLAGDPWFEKPVLYYWLTALVYKIRGVDEYAARLTSALFAAVGIGLVYWLGRDWLGPRGGLLAALVLLTSILYFSLARAASMDMPLAVTLTGAWTALYFMFFSAEKGDRLPATGRRSLARPWPYLFYGSLGLSILVKGPVGIVLVGGSLLGFLVLTRQLRLIKRVFSVPGLLLFLGISLPWYLLCYKANGAAFVREFIVQHNIERFATDRYKHSQPPWFYAGVLFAGFYPWVFQLTLAIARYFRGGVLTGQRDGRRQVFFGLWVAVPLIFFTFSRSKLPGYILPAAPAIALLIAHEIESYLGGNLDQKASRWFHHILWVQVISVFFLGVLLPFLGPKLHFDLGPLIPELSALLIGVGILGSVLTHRRKIRALCGAYVAGVVVSVILITTQLLPQIDRSESCRQLGAFLNQQGYTNRPVFVLGLPRRIEYGLLFYLNGSTRIIYSSQDLNAYQDQKVVLVVSRQVDLSTALTGWILTRESTFDGLRIAELNYTKNQ
jgi:4-amino-4-deoxy-L-arabinose transferase-like glycosyltransferase